MRRITLTLSALVLLAAPLQAGQAFAGSGPGVLAPEAWSRQDPADSLYRAAREAMNRGDYARAAASFRSVWERFPRSAYAADAPYWEAFNRYRTGETRDLERALESLALQGQRYPRATTRESGDAAALAARINGILARRGDAASAQTVVSMAGALVEVQQAAEQAAAEARVAVEQARVVSEGARIAAASGRIAAGMATGGGGMSDVPQECRDQVDTQAAALNALVHMNTDRALPVLRQLMARRDACAPPLRRRAVFLIADKGGAEAVDLLLAAARTDPDPDVRRQAVFWLSEVDDERAVSALADFALRSDDDAIRERAVFALSQHRHPRAAQTLRRVVQDSAIPARTRAHAIMWLGHEGTEEDRAYLRGLFGRTGDASLDERILLAVASARSRENAQWLLATALDPRVDIELRRKAVFWAGEAGASARELSGLYDRLDDRVLRERVLFALSQSAEPAAVERLIHVARNERDPELRRKAIFWLGNSNDPRAADVLIELLANPRQRP